MNTFEYLARFSELSTEKSTNVRSLKNIFSIFNYCYLLKVVAINEEHYSNFP